MIVCLFKDFLGVLPFIKDVLLTFFFYDKWRLKLKKRASRKMAQGTQEKTQPKENKKNPNSSKKPTKSSRQIYEQLRLRPEKANKLPSQVLDRKKSVIAYTTLLFAFQTVQNNHSSLLTRPYCSIYLPKNHANPVKYL